MIFCLLICITDMNTGFIGHMAILDYEGMG
jgi:hypothetical protein